MRGNGFILFFALVIGMFFACPVSAAPPDNPAHDSFVTPSAQSTLASAPAAATPTDESSTASAYVFLGLCSAEGAWSGTHFKDLPNCHAKLDHTLSIVSLHGSKLRAIPSPKADEVGRVSFGRHLKLVSLTVLSASPGEAHAVWGQVQRPDGLSMNSVSVQIGDVVLNERVSPRLGVLRRIPAMARRSV